MDIFIDKLAQKISASEMIKANTIAEAKEINSLKAKIEGYEDLLSEVRRLNLKNMESAEVLNEIIDGNTSFAGKMSELIEKSEENIAKLEELANNANCESEEDDAVNKEYVKEVVDTAVDLIHQDEVRVYRNVQASVNESIGEQTGVIIEAIQNAKNKQKNTFLNVMSIVLLIAVLTDVALKILDIVGIL